MKNVILVLMMLSFTSQLAQAQCFRFKHKVDINFGVGVLPTFVKDKGTAKVLPTTLIANYKFTSNFSLGLAAAYSVTESEVYQFQDGTSGQWRNSYTSLTLRAVAYKTLFDDRWECYGGVNVGYANSNLKPLEGDLEKIRRERRIGRRGSNFIYTAFLGARYAVSDRIGCFGELGFGVSLITVGASVRL